MNRIWVGRTAEEGIKAYKKKNKLHYGKKFELIGNDGRVKPSVARWVV